MTVLTRLQRDFLSSFFVQPAAQPFVLTGGTALAAFHLEHRLSEDMDLFAVAPLNDAELKHSEILELGFQAARDAGVALGAVAESRAARDYVDLFFLAKADFKFDDLLERAKQKDRGLEEFYLAMALKAAEKIEPADLPKMLKPLDLNELKAYFLDLAIAVARRIKPE